MIASVVVLQLSYHLLIATNRIFQVLLCWLANMHIARSLDTSGMQLKQKLD